MKEEEIKKLIQKSKVSTSEDFTNRLMHQIEAEDQLERVVVWPYKRVVVILLILITGIGYMGYRLTRISSEHFSPNTDSFKVPLLIITALIFLLTIRRLLLWKDTQHRFRHG